MGTWFEDNGYDGPEDNGPEDVGQGLPQPDRDNFDGEAYWALYPDVARSGMDPWLHYLQYGQAEGRQYTAKVKGPIGPHGGAGGPGGPGGPRERGGGVKAPGETEGGGQTSGPFQGGPAGGTGSGVGNAPPGWDPVKWKNLSHTTPKYVVGRILAKYPSTPEGLRQALREIQRSFPGASISGSNGDRLILPGVGENGRDNLTIDVGRSFGAGGNQGWQWIDEDNRGNGSGNANSQPNADPDATQNAGDGAGGVPQLGGFQPSGGGFQPSGGGFQPPGGAPSASGFNAQQYLAQYPDVAQSGMDPYQHYLQYGIAEGRQGSYGYQPSAFTPRPAYTPEQITPTGALGQFSYDPIKPMGPLASPDKFTSDTLKTTGALKAPETFTYDPLRSSAALAAPKEFRPDTLQSSSAFKLPTGQEALDQDPGYQFRKQQGLQAVQQSAAGKGLLRSGGTLTGIMDYGQELASQEYGQAVARARDTYGLNQSVRQNEQGQQFSQAQAVEGINTGNAQANYALNATTQQAQQGQQFAQRAQAEGINSVNARDTYALNATTGMAQQGQQFGQALQTRGVNTADAKDTYALNAQTNLAQQGQQFGQALSGYNASGANYNAAADRNLTAQQQNQANAMNASQFATNTALQTNQQNNAFGQSAAAFNAGQQQQGYENAYTAANQQYAYGMQQQQFNLTAQQQEWMQGLTSQQQFWMQKYMRDGLNLDEAYRRYIAQLEYA